MKKYVVTAYVLHFFILISTAVANISIFISMITGIIVIINKKEFFNVFIKKINLTFQ